MVYLNYLHLPEGSTVHVDKCVESHEPLGICSWALWRYELRRVDVRDSWLSRNMLERKKVSPFCCCLKNINTCTLYSFKICLWDKCVSRDCFLKDFLEGEGVPNGGTPLFFSMVFLFSYGSLRFPKKLLHTHLQLHHVPSGQFPTAFWGDGFQAESGESFEPWWL